MQVYWVWYAMLPGLSLRQKLNLLERFSDPEELFHADDSLLAGVSLERDLSQAEKVVRGCVRKGIGILPYGAAEYPDRLRNIQDPPLVLYYKGILPDFKDRPVIAVVGTRKASGYGLSNARQISRQIAACGGLVISGGAYGVDTQALAGALDAEAQTVAVLGCGVDVVYPRTNRHLFSRIQEKGCLVSEYLPGTEPKPWQFPERNRILSGLSNGVLVIEAPDRSGALITAQRAMEQGRDVFVVPGNIDALSCRGSNRLLQEGAYAAFSGWDTLKEYAPQYPQVAQRPEPVQAQGEQPPAVVKAAPRETAADKKVIDNPVRKPYSVLENENIPLTREEAALLACLDRTPKPVDEVIARAQQPASAVLGMLTKLALKGVVINHPGKLVSRK